MTYIGANFVEDKQKYKKNTLLVPIEVGKVKKTTYDLPDANHTYGHKNIPDKEGAGAVVLNWVPHKPSERRGGKKGRKITTKADLAASRRAKLPSDNKKEHTYGRTTVWGTTVKEIVENHFEDEWYREQKTKFEQTRRINKTMKAKERAKKKKLLNFDAPKMTRKERVALSETSSTADPNNPYRSKGLYKMKKFQNVPSRVLKKPLPGWDQHNVTRRAGTKLPKNRTASKAPSSVASSAAKKSNKKSSVARSVASDAISEASYVTQSSHHDAPASSVLDDSDDAISVHSSISQVLSRKSQA